ncbi:tRNA pseudouridine(38-40) synthase TruA [uncultured Rikenella sp.]|uniref:tRNA pseudouridine(38-40) synthase TruA n=1 Tax=uncultured Rikenella sp. TaxID=368003 RepID=UPI002633BD28|nr:tRNA pseudouridine(38-40) synthase TruA [uncultured Rikenella sp.]
MARYFIELTYNGAGYNGWQRQPDAPSVQETLEKGVSTLLGAPHEIVGAGRTDTGVHAAFAVAHFDTGAEAAKILDRQFVYHLNCILPKDIAVKKIYAVPDGRHARFDARRREYKYYITTVKDPFSTNTAWQITQPLDVDAMQTAAVSLMRYEDFTSFAKLHADNKTNRCTIFGANWQEEGDRLVFTIAADRFLRGMVRAIVGTLVDVGRGKITPAQFCSIIESKARAEASAQAPAHGLFLTDVQY